jgi:vanillate O-demethylase monooxygenase subunit
MMSDDSQHGVEADAKSLRSPQTLTDEDVFAALKKTWQPVALTRDLRQKGVVCWLMLGEEIVVADLGNGRLLAARDLCPHRGAKFGLGAIVHGNLQCPYHGWEFDQQGICAKIPSLIDPFVTLERTCLRTYGVTDRYGMIWVKLEKETLAELPDVPEFENAEWTYIVAEPMAFGCGFRREIDNYLDMSHFAFAHKNTLGVAASSQISNIHITHYDDGFLMNAPFPVLANPDQAPGKLQQSHQRRQRVFLPNFTTIRQSFEDGDERVLVHIPSPHTAMSCTVFWALAISPKFAGPAARDQIAFAVKVLDEDRIMVENQRPLEVPIGAEQAVMVPADRLANTYKAALRD